MSDSCTEDKLQTGKQQLQNCLRMLGSASSDNEKMAALLLFAHLMKANDALTVEYSELFKAVDVKFLVRLLKSTNTPEGCSEFMFKSLALNILSGFTENDVLFHPLLISNLRSVAEVLSVDSKHQETSQMFDDGVAILLIFSRKANGCEHLLKSNCIPIICKAVIQNPGHDKLFEIMKGVLLYLPQDAWTHNQTELLAVLEFFSNQFAELQDLFKFSACENLLALLTSLHESQLNLNANEMIHPKWRDEIKKGLGDILQARCKVEYKYTAVKLTRFMIELFGLEWTVNKEQISKLEIPQVKFLLLTLSIITIELRLILESGNRDEIDTKSDVILSCYVVVEKTIEFLICDKDQGWSFDDDVILKIHSLLTGTFDYIIEFLIELGSQDTVEDTPCFGRPIIMATVRVLCVWLSEETNALSDNISKVLPVLLKWAKLSQNDKSKEDGVANNSTSNEILLHLLPPLCHLSADEAYFSILVKEDCHILLTELFKQLWRTQQAENLDYPSHLITLCNVFLNFSVLDVELVKTSKAFEEILESIMLSLPQMLDTHSSVLTAHFNLLGLILYRHKSQNTKTQLTDMQKNFILSSACFIKQVHKSVTAADSSCIIDWNSISELWFLSVQNIVACAKIIPPVKKLVFDSSLPKEMQQWIKNCNETSSSLIKDLKSALLPLANLD